MKDKSMRDEAMGTQRRVLHRRRGILIFPALLALAGCGRAPTFSILGSYFPAWLACILTGIALAALVNLILGRMKREDLLAWPALVYPCLAAFFAFTLWLLFFS